MSDAEPRPRPWGEMRALPEFAAFVAASPVLRLARRGDGHTVLVLPGLGADDRSTQPLRWYLRQLGYWVHGWRLGRNRGMTGATRSGLAKRLDQVAQRQGPVSLVGWSMGGIHALALAEESPQSVRLVITLGSPIGGFGGGRRTLPASSTSIYSRSDAVVPYRMALLPAGPRTENVEVRGSHIGLGHNPAVLYVVADRLAQPVGQWRPFQPPGPLRRLYPSESPAAAASGVRSPPPGQ